jgi:tetratricopeptide (TPR) repeat protein
VAADPIRQDLTARDRSQVFALGSGDMHLHMEGGSAGSEQAVSLAPPFGDRDPNLPLRGRSALIDTLLNSIDRVHVVHGLGGCGKTRLALEAAWLATRRGADVWWVSAAASTALTTGMRALGRRLGLPDAELSQGDAADVVWRGLQSRREPWLLVLDNADDPGRLAGPGSHQSDGRGWLRPVSAGPGRVIVTSRDGSAASWGKWCRLHRVAVLDGSDASGLLSDYSGGNPSLGTDAEASQLAARLGGLPLALKIAGSYLAEVAGLPFPGVIGSYGQYLAALEAGDFTAVFPEPGGELTPDQGRQLIGRTWELSLDLLASRGQPGASRLLRLLATFAGAPVPYELLLDADIMAASPLFTGVTGVLIWQSLKGLYGIGLIDIQAAQDAKHATCTLHPLVRDMIGRRPDAGEQTRLAYLDLVARLLYGAAQRVPYVPEEPPAWPYWQALAAHATQVRDTLAAEPGHTDEQTLLIADAANFAARYLARRGLFTQAEAEFRKLLVDWLRINGPDSAEVLFGRYHVASVLARRGDVARAQAEFTALLDDELRVFGPDDLTTLDTRQFIAEGMAADGDHTGAKAEYQDLLAIRTRLQGAAHPDVLTLRHNVAQEMAVLGDHEGALAEYRSVLAERSQLPGQGPDHPDALATRNQIAMEMAALGDHDGALAAYREVLAAKQEVLGRGHPSTVSTGHCLANEMAAGGDYAAAVALLREMLTDRRAVSGPDAWDTLILRHRLGMYLYELKDYPAAAGEFRNLLADRERLQGPSHRDTVVTTTWVRMFEGSGY